MNQINLAELIKVKNNKGEEFYFNVNNSLLMENSNIIEDIIKLNKKVNDGTKIIDKLSDSYSEGDLTECINELKSVGFIKEKVVGILEDAESKMNQFYESSLHQHRNHLSSVTLNISHDCNLRCKYCFGDSGEYHGKRELMNFKVAKSAIDYLINNGLKTDEFIVVFFGGEPLMNLELLKQTVEYCKKKQKELNKRFSFSVTTNATLLNDEVIDYLINENFHVLCSLDGYKEANDVNRVFEDGSGSYDIVIENIKKYVSKSNKVAEVRVTLTKSGLDIKRTYEELTSIGAKPVIMPVDSQNNDINLSLKDYNKVYEIYKQIAHDILSNEEQYKKYINMFEIDLSKIINANVQDRPCSLGIKNITVSIDGEIYACHRGDGDGIFNIGNVLIGLDEKKYKSFIDQYFMAGVDYVEDCKKCNIRYLCIGGCLAERSDVTGSFREIVDKNKCLFKRKVMNLIMFLYTSLEEDKRKAFYSSAEKIIDNRAANH